MLSKPIGYPVTAKKMWMLSISTVGLWTLYWIFVNFQALCRRSFHPIHMDAEVQAAMLCLSYSDLVKLLDLEARRRRVQVTLPRKRDTVLVFVFGFPALLLDMMGAGTMIQPIFKLIVLCLLEPFRKAICSLNESVIPGYRVPTPFGRYEKLIFVMGVCFWGAVIYSSFD